MSGSHGSALVTGGAGFIGSHLVDALVRAGVDTVVLDDLSSGSAEHMPPGVRLIRADIADPATADVIAEVRADLVIHAAAQVSVASSVSQLSRDRAVNLVGTEHVLRGARLGGAKRFVFISSGGAVYGDTSLADEDTVPAPESPYGVHKLAAEGYVRMSGLSWGIVRFSNVYGPRQRAGLEGGVVAIFADALRERRDITIHGDGEQTRDLIHVLDAVSGTLAVAVAAQTGTWNVCTGASTTINGLLRVMEDHAQMVATVRHRARRVGDVRSSTLSPVRIARDLGWRPAYTLDEGLAGLLASPDAP